MLQNASRRTVGVEYACTEQGLHLEVKSGSCKGIKYIS